MGTIEAKAVIGCNYGDEGKGLVTDYLAHDAMKKFGNCLVVCNNGGAQRSHTVSLSDGTRHAFRHFGSGTFTGADTYLSKYFILNPIIFCQEYEETKKHIPYTIFVDGECRITTPYEMFLNQMLEKSRGDNRHGSCGLGIWETIWRYENYTPLWRYNNYKKANFFDILNEIKIRKHLFDSTLKFYIEKGLITDEVYNEYEFLFNNSRVLSRFVSNLMYMLENTYECDEDILSKYDSVIFENGQGLLLNTDKDNPHTTPSNTGMHNIFEIEKSLGGDIEVMPYYVTRSYVTRHGAGELKNECCDRYELGHIYDDATNAPNDWQGSLRYAALTDDVFQRIENDAGGRDYCLVVTHVDEVPLSDSIIEGMRRAKSNGLKRVFCSYSEVRRHNVFLKEYFY